MAGQRIIGKKRSESTAFAVILFLSFLLIGVIALFFILINDAAAELTANVNHNHIKIDFFYHGSSVSVGGISEPDTDLIIKITSPEGHEVLKQKGKVAGLLWMNTGTLKFENVPNLYSVHSTKKIDELLYQEEMDKYAIGYPALEKHVEISPVSKEEEKNRWFNEFVKLKESSKLYMSSSGKITTTLKDGKQYYYILTDWPYQAPPGDYIVTVYAVKNRKITEKTDAKVQVEQVGIVKTLSNMAKKKGALYGVISIVAALIAGFGVGLIFRKGGGAH